MLTVFESKNFLVKAADPPLVDRDDGGHIIIEPKVRVSKRQELPPPQASELMQLTIVTGAAMENVLRRHGIDIGRINYQDNGNWSVFSPEGPVLHYHLYGRARNARVQKYGQALYFPHKDEATEFYRHNRRLTDEDISAITSEIKIFWVS